MVDLTRTYWVGSLADYNEGRLHGEWFDALLEPDELALAARFMLRSSRVRGAEEWGIFDYDEFYGVELGEYASFETIVKVARGLAEHGEAFGGHWAAYVHNDVERVDQFEDHFRGEWASFRAYLEDLDECGSLRFLDDIPEDMRDYVEVDYDGLARDWEGDFHVAETVRGTVLVYELDT